jgi:type IV fimbrial biogenesis protein FimT
MRSRGLTLVELMVALAVVGVLLVIAVPSFYDFILVQRLKSINAQLVTDLQYARSEAAARSEVIDDPTEEFARRAQVRVRFGVPQSGSDLSCYTIYHDSSLDAGTCDCRREPGARCTQASTTELRTVQIPTSLGVRLALRTAQPQDAVFGFDRVTLATLVYVPDFLDPVEGEFVVEAQIDDARRLRTTVGFSGRPSVCNAGSRAIQGPPC